MEEGTMNEGKERSWLGGKRGIIDGEMEATGWDHGGGREGGITEGRVGGVIERGKVEGGIMKERKEGKEEGWCK